MPSPAFLDLASPQFSTRSQAVYQARTAHWCAHTPYGLAVLRHKEVGQLLRDKRLRQGSHAWPKTHKLEGSFADFWSRSIIGQEGDYHRTLRHIAGPALSPTFIESLKPQFDAIANTLLANLSSKNQCEFMHDFSIPFAAQAICVLLGMKTSRWPQISQDASDLGLAMGVECKRHEATVNAACDRLMALAAELIARARSGDDQSSYIARLVAAFDAHTGLEEQALLDLVVISIFGGVDTTRSQLGLGMALFIEHPEQWQVLRTNPALVPQAIEEMIRSRPTTTWSTREALVDFEFEGEQIKQGETLHMLVHASARDPLICDDSSFDITAKRKMHFGFGGGAHFCLGHYVARTDMVSALTALSQAWRQFGYAGDPVWLPDSGNTSLVRLPLWYAVGS